MNYRDGSQIRLGDRVLIGKQHRGVVVIDLDGDAYPSEELRAQWAYLKVGVMIDTDFGGLVHYDQDGLDGEIIELLERN